MDPAAVRLIFVGHSLGGLVARHALETVPALAEVTSKLVTFGSPFLGATKAVEIITEGEGGPALLSKRKTRELALNSPGAHDLLPRFKCLYQAGAANPRGIRAADLPGLSKADFDESQARWAALNTQTKSSVPAVALAGLAQATTHTITVHDGELRFAKDDNGDGTVHEGSARPLFIEHRYPIAQQHAALQRTKPGLLWLEDQLLNRAPLPLASTTALVGLDLGDSFTPGQIECVVRGAPNNATVKAWSLTTGTRLGQWSKSWRDGEQHFSAVLAPGFYRVTLSGPGMANITKIIHVEPPPAG